MSKIEADMWTVIRSHEQATKELEAMTVPTIEQIRETSDRTTDRLIELQRRREARKSEAIDTPLAPNPTQPPRVMLAFLMGLSVGLSLGAAGVALAWGLS